MHTIGYNGVQICNKKIFFTTRCTKFPSFYIGMCTMYSVNMNCTHYDRKMLVALTRIAETSWIKIVPTIILPIFFFFISSKWAIKIAIYWLIDILKIAGKILPLKSTLIVALLVLCFWKDPCISYRDLKGF